MNNTLRAKKVTSVLLMIGRVCSSEMLVAIHPAIWYYADKGNVVLSAPWKYKGGVEVYLHSFLTYALGGHEWSASRRDHFTLTKDTQVPND
jgi:hypothetical protein